MATDSAMSPVARAALIAAAALALYLGGFFATMSYVARHPTYVVRRAPMLVVARYPPSWILLLPWRPLPLPIRQALLGVWSRIDPKGNDRLDAWQ